MDSILITIKRASDNRTLEKTFNISKGVSLIDLACRIEDAIVAELPEPIIDTRKLYRCKCGEEWKTYSEREQYCPKCGELMLLVS